MGYENYQKLIVWQKSMTLAKQIYLLTDLLPQKELYAMTNQLRRAAISVPSNIAEGHGRNSKAEFIHFLSISRGSVSELETQLLLCHDIGYFSQEQIESQLSLCDEIQKMLSKMITTL